MRIFKILATVATAVLLILASPGRAAELGMPAPPLNIENWVKGAAVDLAAGKGKTVYVIDFWATWCGPCREGIPHLTELQKKYGKDVVFVGVSAEAMGAVKPFVEKLGTNMAYAVALDKTKLTSAAYLEAFGVEELPQAFIIDKSGAIAWMGLPSDGMDEVLAKVVAGKYDVEAVKKKSAQLDKLLEGYFELVTGDTLDPKAAEAGSKFVDEALANPKMLDGFAWTILTHKDVKFRDRDLATRASKIAVDATKGTNYSYLDTYARALFDSGKTAEGIKYQQEAIAKCTDPKEKAELVETLAEFQKAAAK